MPYYIRWLDKTFKSKKQTEELLTPELQNGTLTSHDYELAVGFLPGNHRYYGELGGVGLGASVFYYGLHGTRLFTNPLTAFSLAPLNPTSSIKPRIKPPQLAALTITAYLTGKIIGQVSRLRSHINFTKSLENPSGFEQAMESVFSRTPDAAGGKKLGFSVGWDVPDSSGGSSAQGGMVGEVLGMRGHEEVIRRKRKAEEEAMGGFSSSPMGPEGFASPPSESDFASSTGMSSGERFSSSASPPMYPTGSSSTSDSTAFSSSPSSGPPPPSPSAPAPVPASSSASSRPKSKWDEIRAANARGATASSWDNIRQSHERSRVRNPGAEEDVEHDTVTSSADSFGGGSAGPIGRRPGTSTTNTNTNTNSSYHDASRADEQAKFDAMLEAERNIKSNE